MLSSEQLAATWTWRTRGTPATSVTLTRINESSGVWESQAAQSVLVVWANTQPLAAGDEGATESGHVDGTLLWAPGATANVQTGDRFRLTEGAGVVNAVRQVSIYGTEADFTLDRGSA